MRKILLYTAVVFALLHAGPARAQHTVRGTVVDSSRRYVIEAVTVQTTAGRLAMTDSLGRYRIAMGEKDSIWFSYLGKPTPKYPFSKIEDLNQFDIALRLKSDVLREVRVRSRIYREDSLQNRKDYAKVFNWQRPNLESLTSVNNGSVGFDIQEMIRMFQFRKNRSMARFQERLMEQEREKYVRYRFNKGLVRYLTGLDGEALERFMKEYEPGYAFVAFASEYDFQLYIKNAGEKFKAGKTF